MAGVQNLEGLGLENTGMKKGESLMVIAVCLNLSIIEKWNKLTRKQVTTTSTFKKRKYWWLVDSEKVSQGVNIWVNSWMKRLFGLCKEISLIILGWG